MPKDIQNHRRPRHHPEAKCRGALKTRQGCAGRHSMGSSHRKIRTHPMPRARAHSPAVGSAHSHAAPQAFPCPRAHHAPAAKTTPDAPPHRTTTPTHLTQTQGQGSVERRSRDLLQSPAKKRRKEKTDSNHRKIPNPSHAADLPPTPMPRRRRSPAREPATPRIPQDTPNPRNHRKTQETRDSEEVT